MRIGVTGSSGLIGTALVARLRASGHDPVPIVRRPPLDGEIGWDPAGSVLDPTDVAGLDVIVNLAGAGIGDRRWTSARRREIVDSRVLGTSLIARRIAESGAPVTLLNASAIGFYGDRGDAVLDETSPRGAGFLSDVCVAWEAATGAAERAGGRVVRLRTGIVLSRRGGALAKMLPPFRLGVGGRYGDGAQWMSWISLDDQAAAIDWLVTADVEGPVNLTAPHPVTNAEFARTLGVVLHRPAVVPVPRIAPRVLLGRDMADALLFESQRVVPTVLGERFGFSHPRLEGALRDLLAAPDEQVAR